MEFQYSLQSGYNGSSMSKNPLADNTISKGRKVGLLTLIYDKPLINEACTVFSTRNLTDTMLKITKVPLKDKVSVDNSSSGNDSTIGIFPPCNLENPCLLSTHGLRRRSSCSLNPHQFDETLSLLPLTVCTSHGATCFLPLDYVSQMGEYTCKTYNYPTSKVVHTFKDCVLEFPFPPPIGSSEEQSSELHYSRNCYQCFTPISERRTVYMYRDYIFCCQGCRMKACATRYWYKKMMNSGGGEKKQINELMLIITSLQ